MPACFLSFTLSCQDKAQSNLGPADGDRQTSLVGPCQAILVILQREFVTAFVKGKVSQIEGHCFRGSQTRGVALQYRETFSEPALRRLEMTQTSLKRAQLFQGFDDA